MTSPIDGSPSSTPPIVYDSLVMSVCGGSSTCCSVSRGVVIVARKRCIRAGRHFGEGVPVDAAGATLLAAEAAATASTAALALRARGDGDTELRQAGLDRGLLGGRRRCDGTVDVDPVAAGLDLRDDLRDLPFLVHRLEGEGR